MKSEDIELIVHLKGGKFYKLSSVLTYVVWSGDIKSPSRSLEFEFIQAVNDNKVEILGVFASSTVCFYVGGKEIFRGTIIDVDKSSKSNSIRATAIDIGHFLKKDEVSFNFKDTTACDIAKAVFKGKDGQPSLPWGKIAPAGTKITKMFISSNRYDTIMSAYTEHSKKDKNHKKYMIEVDLDKFNIVEKGVVKLKLMFEEGQNIETASYKESIDNLVNRVLVVDEKGNKIKVSENKELKKLYNFYITKVIEQSKNKQVTDEDIKDTFKGLERTCSLSGYGDISCKSGCKVQVKDSHTGLVGEFYIDKDKHSWRDGIYSISLDLNFDNIMDEKSVGKDEPKEDQSSGGVSGAVDWGHGITASQINKMFKDTGYGKTILTNTGDIWIKYCNAYKVNPALVVGIACHESARGSSNYCRKYNNFGGIGGTNPKKYSSVEEGIKAMVSLVSRRYINKSSGRGFTRLQQFEGIYVESGIAGWVRAVNGYIKECCGKDSTQIPWGTGVTSESEASNNLVSSSAGISNDKQRIILQTAERMVGKGKYTWGGKTMYASDCSGFVMCCHKAAGINISGSTSGQIHNGKRVPSLSQALPGDLIVTQSSASGSGRHVVLYIGNNMMIHNGGPPGRPVTKEKLRLGKWHVIRRCW